MRMIVYAKAPGSLTYRPMNLRTGTVGAPLRETSLIPAAQLATLIAHLKKLKCAYNNWNFQVRYAGTTTVVRVI